MALRPFTEAAKKPKLKSFKAAAKTATPKATTKANGTATAIKKPNPFGFIAKGESADPRVQQLKELNADIIDVSKRLDKARADEPKKFKVFDRLDIKGKQGTDAYEAARSEWSDSMKLVERLTIRLLGMIATKRNLQGQINGTIKPKKKGKR